MSSSRSLPLIAVLAFAGPAVASEPPGDEARNETLVLARSVMPRVAYRALEPTQNPVRVESTLFPGRVFHGTLDGLLDTLVGEDALGDRAPAGLSAANASREPLHGAGLALDARGGAPLGGGAGPVGAGGGIGGAVLRATSGIAETVTSAAMRASAIGGGP